jgi:[acyl-carrier-protein] S-malonyltransferase
MTALGESSRQKHPCYPPIFLLAPFRPRQLSYGNCGISDGFLPFPGRAMLSTRAMNHKLALRWPEMVLAFRGYNITNLGRTAELLSHPLYGPNTERELVRVSQIAADLLHRPVNLVEQVRSGRETTLETYGEALAFILAVELAQLNALRDGLGSDWTAARFSFGFSLGEIGAAIAGGVLDLEAVLAVLLPLADDCVSLAHDATLGVVFTRSRELPLDEVRRLCLDVNAQGQGVIGVSAQLAPNSLLLIGQYDTLDRLYARAKETINVRVHLRKNDHKWPPVHTPIVWQRHIADRAAAQMHTMPVNPTDPRPRVFSLVTGDYSYSPLTARHRLHHWIDHPQRLWDGIYETLASGATTVVHVGPGPNIIPATFKRISADVASQTQESRSLRALSAAVRRQWLLRLLPQRAALLRAPYLRHIVLEDWLLDHNQ